MAVLNLDSELTRSLPFRIRHRIYANANVYTIVSITLLPLWKEMFDLPSFLKAL